MLLIYLCLLVRKQTVHKHTKEKSLFNLNEKNRFYVAVRLFSNRSQMTSRCGKNKKVADEVIAKSVTDVLTTF